MWHTLHPWWRGRITARARGFVPNGMWFENACVHMHVCISGCLCVHENASELETVLVIIRHIARVPLCACACVSVCVCACLHVLHESPWVCVRTSTPFYSSCFWTITTQACSWHGFGKSGVGTAINIKHCTKGWTRKHLNEKELHGDLKGGECVGMTCFSTYVMTIASAWSRTSNGTKLDPRPT